MEAYEKINELTNKINEERTLIKGRRSLKDFTRSRKIHFEDLIFFTLNKRGMSLKMEMNTFAENTGKMEDVSKSAICQQRKKLNPIVFKELNEDYIRNSYDNAKDYNTYKGYIVTAIDGMKIEVPDVEELRREFGVAKGKKEQRTCARALTSCIYDVVNNWVIDAKIDKYNTSERKMAKEHIYEMIRILSENVDTRKIIIIFDRGYPSLEMMQVLIKAGIKFLFRTSASKYNKEIEKMKGVDEEVKIEATKSRIKNIEDEEMREELKQRGAIEVRFVKNVLDTGETEILITNLTREEFKTEEIGELYFKRWKIELAYNIAKNRLDIQNFSGQSKIVIEQEFYAQMLMLNIAEDLRKEANKKIKAGTEQRRRYDYKVNMNTLVGMLRKKFIIILTKISTEKTEEAKEEYRKLIKEIEKDIIPIRPGRKNARKKYKGYNKYKKNYRRSS